MHKFKKIVAILITTFCFSALANQSEPNMDSKKTLVLSYEYSPEMVLSESSIKLHKNSEYSYHGQGKFDVVILGEKQKIVIPAMEESFLFFDKSFKEVKLYFRPTNHWLTLPKLIEKINQTKEALKPIKDLAIHSDEFDLNKLTPEHFENEESELISKYELQHYTVFFSVIKLTTPKEIHPREQDAFQLKLRVESRE
ncbi:MAG: hypothetical protein JSR17_12700 [Proteobacteria bacterium]|nr:hypothetical protein [Pseudomonadota bacterium]